MTSNFDPRVSPMENDPRSIYNTPTSYSAAQFSPHTGDIGSLGMEMPTRPSYFGGYSSSLLPAKEPSENQSFLHGKLERGDSEYSANLPIQYDEGSGKQLRKILLDSSFRWFITAGLCAVYILVTVIWMKKGPVDETSKKTYNTITTMISILLGLNIASAFKDMALNMRWPILSHQKRSLKELDYILHSDSLQSLAKLALVAKGPWVIIACLFWLALNIAAQAAIAMASLTYGFEIDFNAVMFVPGDVTVANMTRFWPIGENGAIDSEYAYEEYNEEFTAHVYGSYDQKVNSSYANMPKHQDIYQADGASLWYNNTASLFTYRFLDNPTNASIPNTFSAYSDRTIDLTYVCESHQITQNGSYYDADDGNYYMWVFVKDGIGNVTVSSNVIENCTTFFVDESGGDEIIASNFCADDQRCTVVQAVEFLPGDPWYYRCNLTLGETQGTSNISYISDSMANIATNSIALVGYTDDNGHEAQTFPPKSPWGTAKHGNTTAMGYIMGTYALGSIAAAELNNPPTSYYGNVPTSGQDFKLNHTLYFYLIIGLLAFFQFFFCIVVAFISNRVTVGPDQHVPLSVLLRPVAEHLQHVSGGKKSPEFHHAKKHTKVIYEKAQGGKWVLNLSKES